MIRVFAVGTTDAQAGFVHVPDDVNTWTSSSGESRRQTAAPTLAEVQTHSTAFVVSSQSEPAPYPWEESFPTAGGAEAERLCLRALNVEPGAAWVAPVPSVRRPGVAAGGSGR